MTHEHDPLPESEIQTALAELPGWELKGGKLHAEFKFKNFPEAFAFMTKVALAAEKINHHPDWSNSYNTVAIDLVTHQTGAVSQLDVDLAKLISQASKTDSGKRS